MVKVSKKNQDKEIISPRKSSIKDSFIYIKGMSIYHRYLFTYVFI